MLLKTLGCDDNLKNGIGDGGKIISLAPKSGAICGFYLRSGIFYKDFKTGVSY